MNLSNYFEFKSQQANYFSLKYTCMDIFIVKDICMHVSEILLQAARELLFTGSHVHILAQLSSNLNKMDAISRSPTSLIALLQLEELAGIWNTSISLEPLLSGFFPLISTSILSYTTMRNNTCVFKCIQIIHFCQVAHHIRKIMKSKREIFTIRRI